MARSVRIEYVGAYYHVMARGNRREAIFFDDDDRRFFLQVLAEACGQTGWQVHAWVLMGNPYHLLLETPEGHLSRGMAWRQNADTRRINTRHRLWGPVFGGRDKSIVVEPGNCFRALLDSLHRNPVRAGLVREADDRESYGWSSLKGCFSLPKTRPKWLRTEVGMAVCGCTIGARPGSGFVLRCLPGENSDSQRYPVVLGSAASTPFPGLRENP